MQTPDVPPREWRFFPNAGTHVGFNGKVYMVAAADFSKLVSWLLDDQDEEREAAIGMYHSGDQRVSAAWDEARQWAGDIATRYCIDSRFQELADFLGFDF